MTFLQIVGGIAVVLFASAALLIVLVNLGCEHKGE